MIVRIYRLKWSIVRENLHRRSNKKSPPPERATGDRTRNRLRQSERPAIEQETASARAIVRRSNKKSPPPERSSGDRTRNRLRQSDRPAIEQEIASARAIVRRS